VREWRREVSTVLRNTYVGRTRRGSNKSVSRGNLLNIRPHNRREREKWEREIGTADGKSALATSIFDERK
jgi:hypothetical protein